jgi:hypothetical protein
MGHVFLASYFVKHVDNFTLTFYEITMICYLSHKSTSSDSYVVIYSSLKTVTSIAYFYWKIIETAFRVLSLVFGIIIVRVSAGDMSKRRRHKLRTIGKTSTCGDTFSSRTVACWLRLCIKRVILMIIVYYS